MSKSEFAAANPDKDGTLDKAEYLAVVETRFRAANPDNDGTIDAREFATPAGKKLRPIYMRSPDLSLERIDPLYTELVPMYGAGGHEASDG